MTGVIATIPRFQFSNALGVPLAGGTLTTYLAGTTTPAKTYQDQALSIANTNPVRLDARGECVLWLDPDKSYKFVLKSAIGVTQWTQDDVVGALATNKERPVEHELQVANEKQKVFILKNITYTPGIGSLKVYLDGFRLTGAEYIETARDTITFKAPLRKNQEVMFETGSGANGQSTADATMIPYTPPGGQALSVKTALDSVNLKLQRFPDVLDLGLVNDGFADASNALEAFWQQIRASRVNYDPSSLDWVPTKYVLPPGKYRITRSINWTNLRAWNVHIEAEGALIVTEASGKPAIDMCDCRGVHINGLAIQTAAGTIAQSAVLIGPAGMNTCGNNRFSNVKTAGDYSIAACHNIGSETTLSDFCYWQNRIGSGFGYAADCNNLLGATSDYVALRAVGVPTSFTSNLFHSCRFANYAASGNAVYLEGTAGWSFDKGCYFLSFDNACVVIRQAPANRTASLKMAGLFETTQGNGLKYCVKFVVDDGFTSACDGFDLDVATPHASSAVIRLETPSGAPMTSGAFSIRSASIRMDATFGNSPTLFSGSRLSFAGELRVRPSAVIDLSSLVDMHGVIYTADASLITRGVNGSTHSYLISDDITLAKQGMQFGGAGTGAIGFQSGPVPRIRSTGVTPDLDLWLSGQGAGHVRFGTLTANADTPITGYITIKDASGAIRKLAVIP